MKIDVALQSYKKPESLIYTLFTLHKYCADLIDTVWINDDKSGGAALELYLKLDQSKALFPWKIRVRENIHRVGWWVSFVRGYTPKYLKPGFMLKRMAWNLYKNKSIYIAREDMRYQWALDSTDKEYLMILHDDVQMRDDIVSLCLKEMESLTYPAIVGDLGQCWRCEYRHLGCSPEKILAGYRPSTDWPCTQVKNSDHKWACRVNEWCAMVSVRAARTITDKHQVFFGNCDADGDTAAYWFSLAVKDGYEFSDPLPTPSERAKYYLHWADGKTGHSVWVNQGAGKSEYLADEIAQKVLEEFQYDIKQGLIL